MKLSNQQIYQYAQNLSVFNINEMKLPVKISFFLRKNIQAIIEAGSEIEIARLEIGRQYGVPTADGTGYTVPQESMEQVHSELNDLFTIEQDLNIHIFKLDEFDNIELTYQELSAIMFMIEE